MQNKNYYGLDLLRGIAGYGVAVTHYFYFVHNKISFEYYSFIFVEIFFVLSGFVLTNQLLKVHKNKSNTKIFYLRRLYRTIPLYIVALIFYTALSNNFNLDFFKFLLFIQKSVPNFVNDNYFMVAWSLSIEEFFYLIFPIYLILFNKISASKLAFYFIILLTVTKAMTLNIFSTEFLRTGTFLRLDAIAIGFLVSIYSYKLFLFKKTIYVGSLFLLLLIIFYRSVYINNESLLTFSFILLAQSLSVFLVLLFCNLDKYLDNSKIKKISKILASQTYSVYLFHLIIMHFFLMVDNNLINNIFVYVFILFILSLLVFKYFEKPILMLRPKYKNE